MSIHESLSACNPPDRRLCSYFSLAFSLHSSLLLVCDAICVAYKLNRNRIERRVLFSQLTFASHISTMTKIVRGLILSRCVLLVFLCNRDSGAQKSKEKLWRNNGTACTVHLRQAQREDTERKAIISLLYGVAETSLFARVPFDYFREMQIASQPIVGIFFSYCARSVII